MNRFETTPISLDRDIFLKSVLMSLGDILQDTVGMKEASGFVSLVGMSVGEQIRVRYEKANDGQPLDRSAMIDALIDLKRRIGGDFYVVSDDGNRIVLGNRACPFGPEVFGKPSLCMMTSNVFGRLVAQSQGYGRVSIPESIAAGHSQCRVVIDLEPDDGQGDGRRYRRATDD